MIGPKSLARQWKDLLDTYTKFMLRGGRDLGVPWIFQVRIDNTLPPAKALIVIEECRVEMPQVLYDRIQAAFVDEGIIPVPGPEQIATMIAFVEITNVMFASLMEDIPKGTTVH
jgi:hypothetical protein